MISKLKYNPALPHCATKCFADKINELVDELNVCSPNGVELKGAFALWEDFEETVYGGTAAAGTAYLVEGSLYVSDGAKWINCGLMQGPKGDTGERGPMGPPGTVGTAENALKLNGEGAEYYATAEQLNQAVTRSSTTIYTDYAEFTLTKIGGVKQINLASVSTNSPIPQNEYITIGILPEEYRPTVEVKSKCFSYIPNSQEIASFLLIISPAGELKIYNYSSETSLGMCVNEVYI